MKNILEKYKNHTEILFSYDDVVIIAQDIDSENHLIYITEEGGERKVVLYNHIDQTKIPRVPVSKIPIDKEK
jgi:hypothetical protein